MLSVNRPPFRKKQAVGWGIRVVEPQDFAVDTDRPGNPNELAERQVLTRSAMLVLPLPARNKKVPATELIADPQAAKHFLVDQEVGKSPLQVFDRGMLIRQRLFFTASM